MTGPLAAKARRVWALIRKEGRQVLRDPSSFAIGLVLPLMLILLFGYGLSFDVKHVPVAIVLDDHSAEAREMAASFQLSPYFETHMVGTMAEANEMMLARKVDAVIRAPSDFGRRAQQGNAQLQILAHGVDGNRARIIESYAQAAVSQALARRAAEQKPASSGQAVMQSRLWFNAANDSRYFLVPGLIVLIITLVGAFMTAMVVAREWERGTFEALFVSPVRTDEILMGKTVPYLILGMGGLVLCLLSAKFLFQVPFRGSLPVLAGASMLYLLVSVSIGLWISSSVKSQYLASQLTLLATFMPALMLSGFIYDLHSVPWAIRAISYLVPARYFVSILQTVFLAGDVWSIILPNGLMLLGAAALMMMLARRATQKSLD